MLELFSEIKEELNLVETELQKIVKNPDAFLADTSASLLKAGGKRLRPAFSILAGRTYNFKIEKVLPLAMALELIHTATLVHDDVVDASSTRRGVPTINAKWGNRIPTHLGDYLFAKSLSLISTYKEPLVSKVLADTSVKMCKGEILQLATSFSSNLSIRDYLYRIKYKTAFLIAASCQLGAIVCGAPDCIHVPLALYGHFIGMAFQITDDILDIVASQHELGKPVGSDLRQGVITLPVIYALQGSSTRERLKKLIEQVDKTENEVLEAIEIVKENGGIEYSFNLAQKYILKAKKQLKILPEVPVKTTLSLIAEFIGTRRF